MVQAHSDVLPVRESVVKMPVGQEVQEDAPAADLYEPAAHAVHPEAFAVPGFVIFPVYPGAQIVHEETEELPGDELVVNMPVGQEVQDVEPAADLYEPAEHAVHPAAFTVPGFIIVPAYPGAQIEQAETDVLPVKESVVNMPVGHEIQDVEPAADLYEPAAHALHPAAFTVPGFVIVPVYPGAQIVQTETDVLPVRESVEWMPAGQEVQEDAPDKDV